jgi:hypothetical protein
MALDLTAMAEAAIRARKYFEQYENRFSNYGAFMAYLVGANALLPKDSIERIKNAQNMRTVAFPVLNKASITVLTARACSITGVEPTSAKPTLTKITRGFEIRVYPKVCDNNYISEMDSFAQGMMNGIRSILVNLDTYAGAQLEANKNTSLATTNLDGVAIVANAYQIAQAQREKLYFLMPTLMERNDVATGSLYNVMTTEGRALMLEYESKAMGNDQNLRGVLEGELPSSAGYRHHRSNRLTNGAGVSETHYVAPFGSLGVFTWIDSDARNRRTGAGNQKAYPFTDGIMNNEWDVAEETICDDLSGTYGSGYEKTYGTKYQFGCDFAFMNAYSSDSTKPIHKIEVLAS